MSYYMDEQLEAVGYYEVTEIVPGAERVEIEVNEDGEAWFVMTDGANFHEERLGREITREDLDRALGILNSQLDDDEKQAHPVSVDFACNSMEYGDGDRFLEWTFPAGHIDELSTTIGAVGRCWEILASIFNVTDPGTFGCPYAFPGDE